MSDRIEDIDEANREILRLRAMLRATSPEGGAIFALHVEHDRSDPTETRVRYVITGPADREEAMARHFEAVHQKVEHVAARLHGEARATRAIVAYLREFVDSSEPVVSESIALLADAVEAGEHRLGGEE